MPNIAEYIWPITFLIFFLGMWVIVIYALRIAHDLARIVLQQGMPAPQVKPVLPGPVSVPTAVPSPTPSAPSAPPTEEQVVDQGLVNFIKKEEGFQPKAQWDYKQYTNGYGTKAASSTEVIDEATAEARLRTEIDAAYKLVAAKYPNLPKGVMQALTDLTYNAGAGWEDGSLGKQVAAQKWDSVKADILLYNHAGGQVLSGLTARREAEVSWFDNPL